MDQSKIQTLAKGIHKHLATGFVIHEIYNVEQALECNGVFVYYERTDEYAIACGRTLGMFVKRRNIATLQGLADALSVATAWTMTGVMISTWFAESITAQRRREIGVMAPISYVGEKVRVFGLITNCYDGWMPRRHAADFPAYTDIGPNPASSAEIYLPFPVGGESVSTMSDFGWADGWKNSTGIKYGPALVTRCVTGDTVDEYWAAVCRQVDNPDQPEVIAELAKRKAERFDPLVDIFGADMGVYNFWTVKDAVVQLCEYDIDDAWLTRGVGQLDVNFAYSYIWDGTHWYRLPTPIPLCGTGRLFPTGTPNTPYSVALSPVGKIDARPVTELLGGAGKSNLSSNGVSFNVLLAQNAKSVTGGRATQIPAQTAGESQAAYETRLSAVKVTPQAENPFGVHYPATMEVGIGASWTASFAAVALTDQYPLARLMMPLASIAAPTRNYFTTSGVDSQEAVQAVLMADALAAKTTLASIAVNL